MINQCKEIKKDYRSLFFFSHKNTWFFNELKGLMLLIIQLVILN